jgi:hypothetical protein
MNKPQSNPELSEHDEQELVRILVKLGMKAYESPFPSIGQDRSLHEMIGDSSGLNVVDLLNYIEGGEEGFEWIYNGLLELLSEEEITFIKNLKGKKLITTSEDDEEIKKDKNNLIPQTKELFQVKVAGKIKELSEIPVNAETLTLVEKNVEEMQKIEKETLKKLIDICEELEPLRKNLENVDFWKLRKDLFMQAHGNDPVSRDFQKKQLYVNGVSNFLVLLKTLTNPGSGIIEKLEHQHYKGNFSL